MRDLHASLGDMFLDCLESVKGGGHFDFAALKQLNEVAMLQQVLAALNMLNKLERKRGTRVGGGGNSGGSGGGGGSGGSGESSSGGGGSASGGNGGHLTAQMWLLCIDSLDDSLSYDGGGGNGTSRSGGGGGGGSSSREDGTHWGGDGGGGGAGGSGTILDLLARALSWSGDCRWPWRLRLLATSRKDNRIDHRMGRCAYYYNVDRMGEDNMDDLRSFIARRVKDLDDGRGEEDWNGADGEEEEHFGQDELLEDAVGGAEALTPSPSRDGALPSDVTADLAVEVGVLEAGKLQGRVLCCHGCESGERARGETGCCFVGKLTAWSGGYFEEASIVLDDIEARVDRVGFVSTEADELMRIVVEDEGGKVHRLHFQRFRSRFQTLHAGGVPQISVYYRTKVLPVLHVLAAYTGRMPRELLRIASELCVSDFDGVVSQLLTLGVDEIIEEGLGGRGEKPRGALVSSGGGRDSRRQQSRQREGGRGRRGERMMSSSSSSASSSSSSSTTSVSYFRFSHPTFKEFVLGSMDDLNQRGRRRTAPSIDHMFAADTNYGHQRLAEISWGHFVGRRQDPNNPSSPVIQDLVEDPPSAVYLRAHGLHHLREAAREGSESGTISNE